MNEWDLIDTCEQIVWSTLFYHLSQVKYKPLSVVSVVKRKKQVIEESLFHMYYCYEKKTWKIFAMNQLLIRPSSYQPTVDYCVYVIDSWWEL